MRPPTSNRVDPLIRTLILTLNSKGIRTIHSCAGCGPSTQEDGMLKGHHDKNNCPYLTIVTRESKQEALKHLVSQAVSLKASTSQVASTPLPLCDVHTTEPIGGEPHKTIISLSSPLWLLPTAGRSSRWKRRWISALETIARKLP